MAELLHITSGISDRIRPCSRFIDVVNPATATITVTKSDYADETSTEPYMEDSQLTI